MIICSHCKGNGYIKIRFEAEEAIEQCTVCHSQGHLIENKYYNQTWTEGPNKATTLYYGPPLDPECFENYTISAE